jgi:hypothetical protein
MAEGRFFAIEMGHGLVPVEGDVGGILLVVVLAAHTIVLDELGKDFIVARGPVHFVEGVNGAGAQEENSDEKHGYREQKSFHDENLLLIRGLLLPRTPPKTG